MPDESDAAVTVVVPSLVGGGAERIAAELASHWAQQGRRMTLISIDAAVSGSYPLDARVSHVGLGLMRVSRSLIAGLWNNTLRVRRLRQAIKESAPRHVVSFTDVTNVTTLLACRDAPWDVIVCERTEPRQHDIGRVWNRLRRRMYARASAIVVQTEAVRSWALAQDWGVPVYVIPNAAPAACDDTEPAEGSPRPAILALGRLSREKGMDLLIEAFASVASQHRDWQLRIFGEGAERSELESLARRLGVSDRLQLAGWTSQPLAALRAGDAFVLPSRYEGFPNALLEAMAAGLACVAFDCRSGPREIIRDGVDGLLVPAGDVSALAAAMNRIMSDVDLRNRLSQRAREVTIRFSRAMFYERWDDVLRGLPPNP